MRSDPKVCSIRGNHQLVCDDENSMCCGSCDNQYCCSEPENAIDENACQQELLMYSSCKAYNDSLQGEWQTEQICDSVLGEFCCGVCSIRYCCRDDDMKLNQTECDLLQSVEQPAPLETTPATVEVTIWWFWWDIIENPSEK